MKVRILRLVASDTRESLEKALAAPFAGTTYLLCPKNVRWLNQHDDLTTFALFLAEMEQDVVFVQPQVLLAKTLAMADLTVVSELPAEHRDAPVASLFAFFKKQPATKTAPIAKPSSHTSSTDTSDLPHFSSHPIEQTYHHRTMRSRIFMGLVAFVLLLAGVLFFISPNAHIVLRTKTSPIPVTQNVIVRMPTAEVPVDLANLPAVDGVFLNTEIFGRETYPTSDVTYEVVNATGYITLFNETSAAKTFVPSRLQTLSGEVFRFAETIIVPARDADGPGALEVLVTADAFDANEKPIGRRGNIPAGTELFFPALSEDAQKLYYAKANLGPLLQGDTLERYFLAETDEALSAEVFLKTYGFHARNQLEEEISARAERDGRRYIFIEDERLIEKTLDDFQFPRANIGQEQTTFEVSGTVTIGGMVFDQEAVINALKHKLDLNRDPTKKILEVDEASLQYEVIDGAVLTTEGWLKLSVSMVGVQALDLQSDTEEVEAWKMAVRREIVGKSKAEAKSFLSNYPEIEEVISLKVRPFWANSLPRILEQIHLRVKH